MPKKPSEATKEKIRAARLEKTFGLEGNQVARSAAPLAVAPEAGDQVYTPPPVTTPGNLAIEQPVTTKEFDLSLRGIPQSESARPGFQEPPFDGLYWKQDGSGLQEDGTKRPGWYTIRMWDGSYNVVEER